MRLRAAVESSPSGLLMVDAGGVIVLVNREVERLFGYSELQAILADLSSPGVTLPEQRNAGRRIDALFSGQERRMVGPMPLELWLRARLGYVEVDLTDATFAPGITTIDAHAFLGYVEIRFPANVRVESHGGALFGFFSLKGAPAPVTDDAERVVRIIGRATFGFVEGKIG